ncbi:MAG: hypothetical protein IJ248_00955 [Candidatus Methanomethylophilaceae archaeon]|nr:hypothetical protein [Candidatus Methanomethylophilaceae archaeon]
MNTRAVAFAVIIAALIIGCTGLGYALYSGITTVEDNTADIRYSVLYITDSQESVKYPASSIFSNMPGSVIAGETFDASSDGETHYYLAYRDTEELTGTPAEEGSGVVRGDRTIIALQVTLSGLSDLNGSAVTLMIGGSSATSVISDGGCTIVGNSFSTVTSEGDEKSSFIGKVALMITPYATGDINISSPAITMTAYHTDLTATGMLKASSMSTTGSSGSYATTSNISYTNSPATGSDLAVLKLEATYDSTWYASESDRGMVTAILHDSVRGTSVSQSCYIDSNCKWTVTLPVKLTGGAFHGSLEIQSVGKDSSSSSPHELSTGLPASITLTMLETTEEVL